MNKDKIYTREELEDLTSKLCTFAEQIERELSVIKALFNLKSYEEVDRLYLANNAVNQFKQAREFIENKIDPKHLIFGNWAEALIIKLFDKEQTITKLYKAVENIYCQRAA
jgi:hypothetical protein